MLKLPVDALISVSFPFFHTSRGKKKERKEERDLRVVCVAVHCCCDFVSLHGFLGIKMAMTMTMMMTMMEWNSHYAWEGFTRAARPCA